MSKSENLDPGDEAPVVPLPGSTDNICMDTLISHFVILSFLAFTSVENGVTDLTEYVASLEYFIFITLLLPVAKTDVWYCNSDNIPTAIRDISLFFFTDT